MAPPVWPCEACHPRPSADLLYYRAPIPDPEPVSAEVYVKKGVPWLKLRTSPGIDHLDIGDLHHSRGPIRVVEKHGDWLKGEVWFHGDYVVPAAPAG
jgi:hypothetical protein